VAHVRFSGVALTTLPGLVMTPRPASEQLVAAAAERIGDRPARIVDVGTGSGAIAVSLALAAPRAEIWASDVSATAVLLARANAHRLGVRDRVHVVRGDLLSPVPAELDLIVANLPYLPRQERDRYLDLGTEPGHAVFAPGDGLGLYRRLLCSAGERLHASGAVIIQLHRRVIVAERHELAALRATLAARLPAQPPPAIEPFSPCGELAPFGAEA
jgi:release factor glutamine methyltransferase